MSIFGSIMSKIFGHGAAASAAPAPDDAAKASPAPSSTAAPMPGQAAGGATPQMPQQPVDVAAILTERAAKAPQKLDWQRSIVDLMKLLDLDSSLKARQELARELNYSGDMNDSAAMNIWLHRQVMDKLAANGGKVPEELRS
ncbi:DUF3597 domain-containing protein [Siccirubricoccus sp. KC 17139]|uniref:DUF3597 domain-containing protein n=1 Tax=Siccirubricoccus soli TaxID=2899147 RepID=A0ABT1D009_9PROT|nr:DUF3597 domain-containing protein [Siccirubricoccus soli]MCP2681387.1 DUF3597 domain-containing protein [Siccirubricoccus soli]